jgi:hypothetical protein
MQQQHQRNSRRNLAILMIRRPGDGSTVSRRILRPQATKAGRPGGRPTPRPCGAVAADLCLRPGCPVQGAGAGANRRRCRTAAAGCTADCLRARRKALRLLCLDRQRAEPKQRGSPGSNVKSAIRTWNYCSPPMVSGCCESPTRGVLAPASVAGPPPPTAPGVPATPAVAPLPAPRSTLPSTRLPRVGLRKPTAAFSAVRGALPGPPKHG